MIVEAAPLQGRIKQKPYYETWDHPLYGKNSITEKGRIDYCGLTDHQKLCLYVKAWNISEICPSRKSVIKHFTWTQYKVSKLFREIENLESIATFSQNTGLLSGRGYWYNAK